MTEFLLLEALLDLNEAREMLDTLRRELAGQPSISPEIQAQMDAFKAFRD